jgi:hypothetical protein
MQDPVCITYKLKPCHSPDNLIIACHNKSVLEEKHRDKYKKNDVLVALKHSKFQIRSCTLTLHLETTTIHILKISVETTQMTKTV